MARSLPCWTFLVVSVLAAAAAIGAARAEAAPHLQLAGFTRAQATYAAMLQEFRQGSSYTESPAGPTAYVWPLSQALAASLAMAELPHVGHYYVGQVETDVNALQSYWLAGPPGVYGALPGQQDAFYDDNEWIGLDLVSASRLLHRRDLLFRAGALFALAANGWSRSGGACPGGVYWQRTPADADRAAVTTANGALLALQLYQATGRPRYLGQAEQMTAWLLRCLQRPDGLIANDIPSSGIRNDRAWSYNQGAAVADLVLLAHVTGRSSYLQAAQRIASASLAFYGTSFATEPRVFVAIFFRDLALLDAAAPNPVYRVALQAYADAQWLSRDEATGLFGSDLLDQAGMVQLYAQLADAS